METKRRPGRPRTLKRPTRPYSFVLYVDDVDLVERVAEAKGVSRSALGREMVSLFLAVNRDFVSSVVTADGETERVA